MHSCIKRTASGDPYEVKSNRCWDPLKYIHDLNRQIDGGRLNWEVAVIKWLEAGMVKVTNSYSQKKYPRLI